MECSIMYLRGLDTPGTFSAIFTERKLLLLVFCISGPFWKAVYCTGTNLRQRGANSFLFYRSTFKGAAKSFWQSCRPCTYICSVKGERNISCKYVISWSKVLKSHLFWNEEVMVAWIYLKWLSWMMPYCRLCDVTQPNLNTQNQIIKGF